MQTAQGNLTVLNPHKPDAKVFWNGVEVVVAAISVNNDDTAKAKVTLYVAEDPVLAEMKAAGIVIRRF